MIIEKDTTFLFEEIFGAKLGKIEKVYQENTQNSDDKRLWCSIQVFPSGFYENVLFWGGGVDFETGFPHGVFNIPREGQYIIVLFYEGNIEEPIACIPVPHPTDMSKRENFYDLVENVNDLPIFHYSGSRIVFREDGTIDIQKRIEENDDEFKNHTLNIEFFYDGDPKVRRKVIKDIDGEITITLSEDEFIIEDGAGNKINLRQKSGEEKIEVVDKHGNTYLSDDNGINLTDKNNNVYEMTSSGIKLTDANNNTVEMKSGMVAINGTNLEVSL